VCHPSAWNFFQDDLRVKMCTKIQGADLFTLFHEQGHLYYFHYINNHSYLFRDSANAGFHEAVGDTMRLSITPGFLREVNLLADTAVGSNETKQQLLNFQMQVALDKIAFLPFAVLIDK
jgi:peptidyl-dipeptidase A